MKTVTEAQRRAKARIQQRFWWLHGDLKADQAEPCRRRRSQLIRRFDALFTTRTGTATLDRLLARLQANKKELLAVLDRLEVSGANPIPNPAEIIRQRQTATA